MQMWTQTRRISGRTLRSGAVQSYGDRAAGACCDLTSAGAVGATVRSKRRRFSDQRVDELWGVDIECGGPNRPS